MRIEYHRTLIADHARNQAFYDALKAVIIPGKTRVADIGAGTGLLGLMASKLGARDVFLYESEAVGAVAEDVLRANRAKGCTVFPCSSLEMDDPPQVDLIVSETLGNYAFEENMIETLADAMARHLVPGGIVLPTAVRQFVAPVVSSRLHDELTVWDDVGFGLDLSIARSMSLNNVYVRTLTSDEFLDADGREWDYVRFDVKDKLSGQRSGDASWIMAEPTRVFGLAYWWVAELTDGIAVSTAPNAPASHWEQLYFPSAEPLDLDRGESLRALIRSSSSFERGTHLSWSLSRAAPDGKVLRRHKMDLDQGYLP